jgi:hypothetical protein
MERFYYFKAHLVEVVIEPSTLHGSAQSPHHRSQQRIIKPLPAVLEVPGEDILERLGVQQCYAVNSLLSAYVERLRHLVEHIHFHQLVAKLVQVRGLLHLEELGSRVCELLDCAEAPGAGQPQYVGPGYASHQPLIYYLIWFPHTHLIAKPA